MSIGLKLKWIKSKMENSFKMIFFFVISILLSFFILRKLSIGLLFNTVLFSSAFYLFLITIKDLLNKKSNSFSQKISHFGFSLLILSILLNSVFSKEIIINMKVGEKFVFKSNQILFEKMVKNENSNYNSIVGHFKINDKNGKVVKLKPEIRIYNQPITITSEADIKTTLLADTFLVMNFVKDKEYFNIRYQVKAFMIWIWISVILISYGGLVGLFKKKYEK